MADMRIYDPVSVPKSLNYVQRSQLKTATIASGESLSSEFDMEEFLSGALITPGAWTAANAVLMVSDVAGETSAAITVTGAALGDFVMVAAPYDLQGITCNGYVSAANTVKIRLQNETGGPIDLASGTWKVKVIK